MLTTQSLGFNMVLMMITTQALAVRFGNKKTVLAVDTLAAAKKAVDTLRDRMELEGRGGASRFPEVRIIDLSTGNTVAHVSYNGRIWEGEPRTWTPSTREILL
jgi:hypothetical protein